jgi:integrase
MKTYYEPHKPTIEGREYTLYRVTPGGQWKYRYKRSGKQIVKTFPTSDTKDAERWLRDLLRSIRDGLETATRDALRQRKAPAPPSLLLSLIIDAYRVAPEGPIERTRRENITALGRVINLALGTEVEWQTRGVDILTPQLVRAYKLGVLARAKAAGARGKAILRAQATADDTLRQARSIFAMRMLEHYRHDKQWELPALDPFREAPGFGTRKTIAYQRPDDGIVDRCLAELEATKASEPERYLICWLAITFGLRKSEIAAARSDWFVMRNGRMHIEIRGVEDKKWSRDYTKNGEIMPSTPAALGGWAKIGPMITAMAPGVYLIKGSRSYRTDIAFRKVNLWLRKVGWQTSKAIHELRKLAGSEVIMSSGIYAASQFLRHGNISTTQKYYGRYANVVISDQPIKPRTQVPNQVPSDTPLDTPLTLPDSTLAGISDLPARVEIDARKPTQTTDMDGVTSVIT